MTGDVAEFNALIARAEQSMSSGRRDEALILLDRALDIRPRDVHALNAKGALLGGMRRYGEAIDVFEKAALERPDSAELQYNVAFALQCQRRFTDAIARYDRAVGIQPAYPEALTNRALCFAAVGRHDEAIASGEAAARLNPNDPRFLNNLGHALFGKQDAERARRAFEAAVRIAPNYFDARCNLGRALVQLGLMEDAIAQFEAALRVKPGHVPSIEGLAICYRSLERYDDLVTTLRRHAAAAPQAALVHAELAAALATVDRREEAAACFRDALRLEPRSASVHARIGQAQLELGEIEAAEASFATAGALDPASPYFQFLLLGLRKGTESGTLANLEAIAARADDMEFADRAYLHFALAKALSDAGDNERSFSHSVEANRQERRRRSYDERETLSSLALIGAQAWPDLIARCRSGGDASQNPIFVVGMPRSGSTLVEQMLAAHRDVLALGELRSLQEAIHTRDAAKGSKFPSWLGDLTAEDVRAIAERYGARTGAIAESRGRPLNGDLRLVDKMPGNFQHAALIHLALPNARIIHTKRDPIDTCLSCFRYRFEVAFSYDLGELGRYYRAYERLMARWSEVLPETAILHVDHEELVSDFEAGARRILAHCGLEWDDACLSFQDVKRPVRTVSALQVRQPLMKGRRQWRPSDDVLRPLLDELGR